MMAGFAEILMTYGPWGVAALAIGGMVKLYLDGQRVSRDTGRLLDQRYAEQTQIVSDTNRTLVRVSEAMERMATVLQSVDKQLTACDRQLVVTKDAHERVMRAVEQCERRGG